MKAHRRPPSPLSPTLSRKGRGGKPRQLLLAQPKTPLPALLDDAALVFAQALRGTELLPSPARGEGANRASFMGCVGSA